MYTAKTIPILTGEAAEHFEHEMQESHPVIDLKEAYSVFKTIMKRSSI